MHWIYALRCPVNLAVRYVGRTTMSPLGRLATHLSNSELSTGTPKAVWLAGLVAEGMRPLVDTLQIVDTGNKRDALAAERTWIRRMRARGAPLLNVLG